MKWKSTINNGMTIQSSGAISMSDINTELGRSSSATISLGGSAERGLADVSSGAISLSDFYGASSIDAVPNAVNWNDIFESNLSGGSTLASTNPQTITGINTTISINFVWTTTFTTNVGSSTIQLLGPSNNVSVNGSSSSATSSNLSVSNNNSLSFTASLSSQNPSQVAEIQGNISVRNASDGNTVLDTINVSMYIEDIGGGGGGGL